MTFIVLYGVVTNQFIYAIHPIHSFQIKSSNELDLIHLFNFMND